MEPINIEETYQELLQYLSCLGKYKLYSDFMSRTLRYFDNSSEEIMKIVVSLPMIDEEHSFDSIKIAWKAPQYKDKFRILTFTATMNQKTMFDILLFDITNWKLDYLNNKPCIVENVEKK